MRQLIRLSGDTMDRDNTTNLGLGTLQGPSLPQLPEGLESAFNRAIRFPSKARMLFVCHLECGKLVEPALSGLIIGQPW
jgi:hypothetical protein